MTVQLDGKRGGIKTFDAAEFQTVRHGYAGTIYRGQGRTLDQTYLYHSEHWRSAASYVALTRHREKAEIFVATDTLNTRPKGEPWMKETGGASALGHENYESAQRSYAKWQETNPQAAARHGFVDYVQYVQDQWAKNPPAAENDRAADLRTLARQMARVDERRAASQFYEQHFQSGFGDSPSPDSGPSRDTEQSHNDASPERPADEPTPSSHRKGTATGGADTGGQRAEREVEDEAARAIREIAEAAKAREDDGRSRERDGLGGDEPPGSGARPRPQEVKPGFLALVAAWCATATIYRPMAARRPSNRQPEAPSLHGHRARFFRPYH